MALVYLTKEVTSSNTLTEVGTVSADSKCNIYILNKDNSNGTFRLAISATSPTNKDYIFYDFPIKQNGTFVVTDVFITATHKVWIYSPANFIVRVDGTGTV